MVEIVENVLRKLDKDATLDQIREALNSECKKVTFEINKTDWREMFDDILVKLSK